MRTQGFTTEFEFETSQEAWGGINEYLATHETEIASSKAGGGSYGPEMVMYNVYIIIMRAWVDPEFDFGRILGYTVKKWTALVKNYVDFNYLDLIKQEIQRRRGLHAKSYNYTYHFANKHGSGKDCLISLTFAKRVNCDHPILIYTMRVSEATKRLIFDLLLVQRIGEYIYGEGADFEFHFAAPSVYISAECFCMFNNYKKVKKIMKPFKDNPTKFYNKVMEAYNYLMNTDVAKIKYKVHRRAAKQIQLDEDGNPISGVKPMLAKDLVLVKPIREFPDEVISPSQRKEFLKKERKALGGY